MVLAGRDDRTGIDDSFRREWIRRRMEALASVFGIDVLTYAITSNHGQSRSIAAQWHGETGFLLRKAGSQGEAFRLEFSSCRFCEDNEFTGFTLIKVVEYTPNIGMLDDKRTCF